MTYMNMNNPNAFDEVTRALHEDIEQRRATARAEETFLVPELPTALVLDFSGSMNNIYDVTNDVKSRRDVLIDNVILFCRRTKLSEQLAQSVHLTIIVFNTTIQTLIENEAVCDLDIDDLEQKLHSLRPTGVTALGKAIVETLNILSDRKQYLQQHCRPYLQPCVAVFTDGIPTNSNGYPSEQSMSQAYHAVDTWLSNDKLTVIPVGISSADADDSDFRVLSRLLSKDADHSIPVLRSAADIRRHFRFIGQTLQAIEKGVDVDVRSYPEQVLGCTAVPL